MSSKLCDMKNRIIKLFGVLLILLPSLSCAHLFRTAKCKERNEALRVRNENLQKDAREQLKIGTPKAAVVRFFAEHGIPVTFSDREAAGAIHVIGCAPFGCGTDDAEITISVQTDKAGTVTDKPRVAGIYTDCL